MAKRVAPSIRNQPAPKKIRIWAQDQIDTVITYANERGLGTRYTASLHELLPNKTMKQIRNQLLHLRRKRCYQLLYGEPTKKIAILIQNILIIMEVIAPPPPQYLMKGWLIGRLLRILGMEI